MKNEHIPEVRKDNPDIDRNRDVQSDRALDAFEQGYTYGVRHAQDDSCDWCLSHDGEIVPIEDIISGKADHKNGHCTWTFVVEDEE